MLTFEVNAHQHQEALPVPQYRAPSAVMWHLGHEELTNRLVLTGSFGASTGAPHCGVGRRCLSSARVPDTALVYHGISVRGDLNPMVRETWQRGGVNGPRPAATTPALPEALGSISLALSANESVLPDGRTGVLGSGRAARHPWPESLEIVGSAFPKS